MSDTGYVGVDRDYFVSVKEVLNITAETGALETQNRVRELPPADVVEVVRCKDCKHWNKDTERNDGYGYCSYWQRFIAQAASEDIQTYKDVFCCYGVREDNE